MAKLAKLKLADDEIDNLVPELQAILGYVEILNSADVGDIKPTYQVTGLKNVMRRDEVVDYSEMLAKLMSNIPSVEKGHIKVKRVLT